MHVALLGAGALGSVLAGTLASTNEVTLVGRDNPHLQAIQRDGLRIRRPDGSLDDAEVIATADHAAVESTDVVVLAVKSYDTEQAMADIAPYLGSSAETQVLTVQNGLGNAETIREFVQAERILAGTTTNGAYIEEPGLVRHTGWGQTTIGRMWGKPDRSVEALATAFRESGFETAVVADIEHAIWEKVLVNVGINPITALARVPNGRLNDEPSGEALLESAVREAVAVARAEGHEFETDPVERTKAVARDTGENRSSMLQDVENGSKTEIRALNGAVVRRADEAATEIPVPVNRTLTNAIQLLETGFEPDVATAEGEKEAGEKKQEGKKKPGEE